MSKNYELIKGHYDAGRWSLDRVRSVVGLPLGITAEEFREITGLEYQEEE